VQETIAGISAALDRIAVLSRDDDEPSRPRGPASAESIERAQQAQGKILPSSYAEFLRVHDGWPDSPWGVDLFGTVELEGPEYEEARGLLEFSDEDGDVPEELENATLIATATDGISLVFLLDSGQVVEFGHEEEDRHADFAAYLAAQQEMVEDLLDAMLATQERVEADWDAGHRAAKEGRLLAGLRALPGSPEAGSPRSPAPPASGAMPGSVTPADLVVRVDAGDDPAVVRLNLILYLGSYPSQAEVLACFRAFRRHFPVIGAMRWGLPSPFFFSTSTADDPDDESWAEQMYVDAGLFGIRLSVGDYTLNVCGIPPSGDGTERASFCEVIVPADADHEALARLAGDLVAVLPVRSGHGGFSAYAQKHVRPDPYGQVFSWCRRFFGLGVGYLDGFLEFMPGRVLGAGWLTVLGPTFAQYLAERAPLRFESAGITVRGTSGGVIIRAGDAPTLGDVQRGEFPALLAEVEQYLLPLKANGWHRTSTMVKAGHWWLQETDDLPGAFTEHRATAAWLNRLLDPAGFLAPTARERGEAILERLIAEGGSADWLDQWHKQRDKGFVPLRELLRLIANAAIGGPLDTSVSALEFVTSHPGDAPDASFNNLLVCYLQGGRLEQARAFLPAALGRAPKHPGIFHNAACVAALSGDLAQALEYATAAQHHGYDKFGQLRVDEDLRALWDHPQFIALFG
jgi:hypothetical protein